MNYSEATTAYRLKLLEDGNIDDFLPLMQLQISINDYCNSRCNHCFIWKNKKLNDLSSDDFCNIIMNLQPSIHKIDITGGEPFIKPDIEKFLQCCFNKESVEKVSITTNGLLKDRIISMLKNIDTHNKKFVVFLSIDGYKEVQDKVRGIDGYFDKTIATLKELVQLKHITTKISFTMNNYNYKSFKDLNKYLNKKFNINIDDINIPNVSEYYYNDKNVMTTLSPEGLLLSQFKGQFRKYMMMHLEKKDVPLHCTSGINKIVLDSFGNLRMCFAHWRDEFVVCNIKDHDFDLTRALCENKDKYIALQKRTVRKQCIKCVTSCEYGVWGNDVENQAMLQ